MLTRLNVETRGLHPFADAHWLELLAADVDMLGYVERLSAVYGFEAPVEAAIAMTRGIGTVIQMRERARSGLIVQDLLALGLSPAATARLPQCLSIAPFRDVGEALGWLYVVERATLLHDAIRSHLSSRLGGTSFAYLSAYDPNRWLSLGKTLDLVAATRPYGDLITAGAVDAFACQREWFGPKLALARAR